MQKKINNNYFLVRMSESKPYELREYLIQNAYEKEKGILFEYLKECEKYYPDVKEWYSETVIKEMENGNENIRDIIIAISNVDGKRIISGISIIKKDKNERKICTLRVLKDFRKQGICKALFEECFEALGTRTPVISFPEEMLEKYRYYIDEYHFELYEVLDDYYRIGKKEYVYNGYLSK